MPDIILFYIIFISVIIVYIFIGYSVVKILPQQIKNLNPIIKLLLLSFCYAFVFGIGIAASGGDPGVGFPLPIILAIFITKVSLINSVAIPLLFWWTILFAIIFIRHLLRRKIDSNLENTNTIK